MEIEATSVGGHAHVPAPRHVPDLRPTADAAAVARNPRPEVPLGTIVTLPPSAAQVAAVSRNIVSSAAADPEGTSPRGDMPPVSALQRTLKPYGVSMLPSRDIGAATPVPANDAAAAGAPVDGATVDGAPADATPEEPPPAA